MADQSDVETAIVSLVSNALYPSGTEGASANGQPCRIYRGWPNPASLDADLLAGTTNTTVIAVDGTTRNVTRYPDSWLSDPPPTTLTVSTAGPSVTFGGTADAGQLAGVAIDGTKSYVYRTQPADTADLVAANLAGMLRGDYIADLSAATITVFGAENIVARVAADTTARMEVRRQTQRFRITVWCNGPNVRDAAAAAIDVALAPRRFIPLSDGSLGRLVFATTSTLDRAENAALYRRDLFYDVEYPTTISAIQPTMLFSIGSVNGNSAIG
jgi:hypothetical protein